MLYLAAWPKGMRVIDRNERRTLAAVHRFRRAPVPALPPAAKAPARRHQAAPSPPATAKAGSFRCAKDAVGRSPLAVVARCGMLGCTKARGVVRGTVRRRRLPAGSRAPRLGAWESSHRSTARP